MFKKPKRHFRQRRTTDGSENEGSEEDSPLQINGNKSKSHNSAGISSNKFPSSTSTTTTSNSIKKITKEHKTTTSAKKASAASSTPISFEFEGGEHEEGEAFQIKKSSQSRKIIKRLKRETKEESSNQNSEDYHASGMGTSQKSGEGSISIVLNGDRALDMDLDSDSEPENEKSQPEEKPKHEFLSVLERGEIPDANLIHLARKKRAQAREQGDFIPLDDTQKAETAPASTQRLVRDDDNDMSDEERVDFTLNSAQRERQHMKDTFLAAEHGSDEEGSDQESMRWEQEQIRKVVGGREQVAVEPDNYHSYYSMSNTDARNMGYDSNMPSIIDLKPLPDTLSVEQVKRSLTERLSNLEIVHRVHTQERDNVHTGLVQSKKSTDELENKTSDGLLSKLNRKYTFMQQMRSYIRDVLECFNDKYTRICELDYALMVLAKNRSEKLCKRRQEDIRDEASDCASISRARFSVYLIRNLVC